jgi:hypothetical protein
VSIIMCAPPLWRFVRAWRTASAEPDPAVSAGTLGRWAATALTRGARDILLGVETATCLAIVCELGSETTFTRRWKQALEAAFEDMRVPLACLPGDVCVPRLQRIKDEAWDRTLDAVEFVCDTELHLQSDLRIVQRELNEFPHDHPPHYVPVVAVRRLFGLRALQTRGRRGL